MISENVVRRFFRLSLWLKAAHSLIEVIGAVLLYLIPQQAITALVTRLTWSELMEDPQDIIANSLRQAAESFGADAQAFAAWYLFSHGAIKLILVLAILADRKWAYPVFIAGMIGFIAYQLYLMALHVSIPLVAITILDVVVLALAIHEYRFRTRLQKA